MTIIESGEKRSSRKTLELEREQIYEDFGVEAIIKITGALVATNLSKKRK